MRSPPEAIAATATHPEDESVGSAFHLTAESVHLEIEGPEEFVRAHLEFLLPFVRRATGGGTGIEGPAPVGVGGVGAWWRATLPPSANPSLQDTILLFAYYMRTYRKTVFVSEDIRRCFAVLGMDEPKSLLQILGTLKRDHGYLLNAGHRGEYMMNTTGIARVRQILGLPASGGGAGGAAAAPERKTVDARSLFTA